MQKLPGPTYGGGAYISTASVFEITALHTAGRLQFTMPVERWIRESIDRWLVATAREHNLQLVTAERRILDYASTTKLVRVIDAST
ncbi:MAG: hypothetical protein HQ485_08575 [Acidobacteria bacterium]|nr:hypothetical protein [Acidobacteriota bacterium]